jgi:hypothetical protein
MNFIFKHINVIVLFSMTLTYTVLSETYFPDSFPLYFLAGWVGQGLDRLEERVL